jgi:hypothetical protein
MSDNQAIKAGDLISCPRCGEQHTVQAGTDDNGDVTMLYYPCGEGVCIIPLVGPYGSGTPNDIMSAYQREHLKQRARQRDAT